jgi:hypothetical protein
VFLFSLTEKREKQRENLLFCLQKTLNEYDIRIHIYFVVALNNHSRNNSMCQIGTSEEKMSPNDGNHQHIDELITRHNDIKYFVDLYTAALHLR